MEHRNGIAGRMAAMFIDSKLTPLLILASLLLGTFAVLKTPREEEPQITVPMADVLVRMPGATAQDVEQRLTYPVEKLVWEVPGVEYVYSISNPGQSTVIVRFQVGRDEERALVRLRESLQSRYDQLPAGATTPIIKPHAIDDVPVLALTLHSKTVGAYELRQIATRVEQVLKSVPDVSKTSVIGGRRREVSVALDSEKLSGYNLTPQDLLQAIERTHTRSVVGQFNQGDLATATQSGEFLRTGEDVSELVVSSAAGRPVTLGDLATVHDGPEEATNYVFHGTQKDRESFEPAVTLALAKRKGVNAIDLVQAVMAKVESLKGSVIPSTVTVTTTRDYGASSAEKSNELLFHMGIAVVSVTVLIAFALGGKESLVVLVAIPVTLALTLLVFYLFGFTLNRITLFALIFSIGILVDDAIVVVENIVRHLREPGTMARGLVPAAIHAVDEVGNPTILATLAVIAAILPMAFVGGLMGPYMRPIPVGASAAMVFSLLIAFIVTPWAAVRILKAGSAKKGHHGESPEGFLTKVYRRIMTSLLRTARVRAVFFGLVGLLLLGSMALVGLKVVTVKMLPFDNKNEFQIVVDMPTGTSLERTLNVSRQLAEFTARHREVTDYQIYAGTSGPFNFNGLVRHYFLRSAGHQADIQVNLTEKHERSLQSHDIAKELRPGLEEISRREGARIKIAEVPPGPPVLQTLVAEVYGPDAETRLDTARRVKEIFQRTSGVADVDWYVDDDQPTLRYDIDVPKAVASGVRPAQINQLLETGLAGTTAGLLQDPGSREEVPIRLRLPQAERSDPARLSALRIRSEDGSLIAMSELTRTTQSDADKAIYHKNLLPVVYVTGDVTGRQESPVYAILQMNQALSKLQLPKGVKLNVLSTRLPEKTDQPAMKWDGEWHITYEVFRDLGIAFAAVLVLIYILVVAWFQDFKTPIVIMAPIPLTLVGILPAHAMMGAFFTATSMIGFIAGAGIIVRNSIILVDFIELRRREGSSLEDAVVDAGAIRFRPMLLTAAAVIVGSFVILFDPIFQGLAIALMAGEIASTLLSRLSVPVLYFLAQRKGEIPVPR